MVHGASVNRSCELDWIIVMLKWALGFFIVSIIPGALGSSGIAAGSAKIAKILFGIFIVIFLVLLVLGLAAGEAIF